MCGTKSIQGISTSGIDLSFTADLLFNKQNPVLVLQIWVFSVGSFCHFFVPLVFYLVYTIRQRKFLYATIIGTTLQVSLPLG